jgi:N-6 DNA Methylase
LADAAMPLRWNEIRDRAVRFSETREHREARNDPESPADITAAEIMAKLHDALSDGCYEGEHIDRLLTRISFCLFAEDNGIFEPNAFTAFIENHTAEDGSDLGPRLEQFFQTLNTPLGKRQEHLDEVLASLPYVNSALFAAALSVAAFSSSMRGQLLACAALDWSAISPAIFGSIVQGVMDGAERRQIGAHYTGEADIIKVLRGLFLDDLEAELAAAKAFGAAGDEHDGPPEKTLERGKVQRLSEIHDEIAGLRFLDPACGCGNFLILAYRELRRIEQEILVELSTLTTDIVHLTKVSVDQFFGIEILEFPAEIARVGMWLMDHQMNARISQALGQYFVRLPPTCSAHIVCGNALRSSWEAVLAPGDHVLVLGNPPFVGKKARSPVQKADMEHVFAGVKGAGTLDYVAAWYLRAAQYLKGNSKCAFVATNSITQGEQPGILWPALWKCGISILFAHRTFLWQSEARGRAHVHVVIIGLGRSRPNAPWIIDYDGAGGQHRITATNISPYLVDGPNVCIQNRREPKFTALHAAFGNMPNDGGHLLLTEAEKVAVLAREPGLREAIRPFMSAHETINGVSRWCFWLGGIDPKTIRESPELERRLTAVRQHRESSDRKATRAAAGRPGDFAEIRQPVTDYILIPRHPSERRRYIPMGYFGPDAIVADSCICVAGAGLYDFGVLCSSMHVAWARVVGGRIKSDIRYSVQLIFNNFPWPSASDKARRAVEAAVQHVFDVRASFSGSTLADLYDPLTTPAALVEAHHELDSAVERCYRSKRFEDDRERVEYLLSLYTEEFGEARP